MISICYCSFLHSSLCCVGPLGVGRRAIVEKLTIDHSERFAAPVPDTSRARRPDERDGVDYNFVDQYTIQSGIRENLYVESGNHDGILYGTQMKVIQEIGRSGKVGIVPLFPKSLKVLKFSNLKPYVVYLKPKDDVTLSPQFQKNGTSSDHGQKGKTDEPHMTDEAKRIEAYYAHYFDRTLVVEDAQRAAEELIRIADRLQSEPQWMYANWVR